MKKVEDLVNIYTKCKKIKRIRFKKGEVVANFIPNRTKLGIIIEGEADLIRYDLDGNKTIIERLEKGSVYGELLHLGFNANELLVEAKTNVNILELDYDDLVECMYDCPIHNEYKQIIFDILLQKIVKQNTRVEVLTQRNMRDKILSYFDIVSLGGMKRTFDLPFSFTDLADYLNVDRSAMTREIANLIEDGFIVKNGKRITLLY